MVIDPRMLPSMGPEVINGQINDKTMDLLDILNKVAGNQGFGTKTLTLLDGALSSDLSLGVYNIEPDADASPWANNQIVYFQSTPQRLSQIQSLLTTNLNRIQDDIVDNVNSLFDLIQKGQAEGGLDIENQINAIRSQLETKTDLKDILDTGGQLEDTIRTLLTDDSAINTIVDKLFEKFRLSVGRLNQEIFALLDDGDADFSDGSTDMPRYIVAQSNGTAQVVDTIDEVFNLKVAALQASYETQYGAGTWTQELQNQNLFTIIGSLFQGNSLQLSEDLVNYIIADKDIPEEDLALFKTSSQFSRLYDLPSFIQAASNFYGTSGDLYATVEALYKDQIEATTPKYFNDARTVRDIITGKADNMDSSNINSLFRSAGDQVTEAALGVIDLLGSGFSKLSRNEFESFVRKNPILLIQALEDKKANSSNNSEIFLINAQIKRLQSFNSRKIATLIRYYSDRQARGESPLSQEEYEQAITELKQLQKGKSEDIDLYNNFPELSLEELESPIVDINLDDVINVTLDVANAHSALYAMENIQASKMNSTYDQRQLPQASQDGSMPDDNSIPPPLVSPSLLSTVISAVGNQILYKAYDLLNNPDVPDESWLVNQNSILKSIDEGLASGELAPGTTAGQQFLATMKAAFKDVIKKFVIDDLTAQKAAVDNARDGIQSIGVLEANDPFSTDLPNQNPIDINAIQNSFAQIDQALGGDLLNDNNYINKNGLGNVKKYLTDLSPNIQNSINAVMDQISQINQGLIFGDLAALNSQLASLQNLLASNNDLLNGNGKVGQVFSSYINKALNGKPIPPGQDPFDFFQSQEEDIVQAYKDALLVYSDKAVNHLSENSDQFGDTDIEEAFKAALASDTVLDLNGDGENDFKTIENTIGALGNLSTKLSTNLFGTDEAKPGDYTKQDIKRLIRLMYVLDMLEWSDWEYRTLEGDLSRYAVE